ncbi:MAG: DsbA family protein, partial [Planctomyces sp.]
GSVEGMDSSEVVSAPGEYVSAPGEVFEAPGDIEAPVEAAPSSEPAVTETVPTPLTNESARSTDREDTDGSNPSAATEKTSEKAEKAVTDVTASLLLIVPGTISRMGNMTQMLMPAADTGTASDSAAIAAAAAATQVALLAEGDVTAKPASGETAVPEAKNPESSNAVSGSSEASGSAAPEKKEAASADTKPAKEPEKKEAPKPEPRLVSVSGNLFRLNVAQWPLLGTPDAKYIFVEMFDYTCPHCRNTHSTIHQALEKYGKDLAIVTLVVPLHPSCNSAASGGNADACELARLSLGVWRVKPSAFREYHDWMFSGGRNRTAQEARQQAEKLVGAEALKAELGRKTVGEYIARHVDLYRKVGSGSVPKIMFPQSTMTGEV